MQSIFLPEWTLSLIAKIARIADWFHCISSFTTNKFRQLANSTQTKSASEKSVKNVIEVVKRHLVVRRRIWPRTHMGSLDVSMQVLRVFCISTKCKKEKLKQNTSKKNECAHNDYLDWTVPMPIRTAHYILFYETFLSDSS